MGLDPSALMPYGRYIAKVPLEAFPNGQKQGSLVVVTSITPTPEGEGKTTTAIGLVEGLARLGYRAVLTLRQPSLGPLFGAKGGGTGGGKARVVPEEEINLQFTGDAYAVASAHNLLMALAENALHHRLLPDVAPEDLTWNRVTDVEDRGLRHIITGLGGRANSPLRESSFTIDAASEVMAVLSLARDRADLRERLSRLVVGFRRSGEPLTADDLGAVGPMMALLRHALLPNLVQTLEGQPALVHTGPFANIAHGCSSVVADRLALACADFVVTEAGFGADLGFEKFMHIKARALGVMPRVAVVVVTTRALKWHGGLDVGATEREDLEALRKGCENLEAVIGIVRSFGVHPVVALNRWEGDSPREVTEALRRAVRAGAVAAVESRAYTEGGEGARELAEAVASACREPASPTSLYTLEMPLEEKVRVLATRLYGASAVEWSPEARRALERFKALGWDHLPVCVAKTHLSLSHDPSLRGRPSGYTFPITRAQISAGAGFVYLLAGRILTMPGLPPRPHALNIDLDPDGKVTGLT